MKCKECGYKNAKGFKFCKKCGKELTNKKRGLKAWQLVLLITVLLVLISGAVFFAFYGSSKGSIKEGTYYNSWRVMYGEDEPYQFSPLMEVYAKNVKYKTENIKINDDGKTGKATVTVTTPDLLKIVTDCIDKYTYDESISSDENKEKMTKLIEKSIKNNPPVKKTKLVMDIKKDGNKWKFIANDDWYNAVNGDWSHMLTYLLKEMIK